MLHKFSVGSIDVVSAYLQSGSLPRRVSVRSPRGWAKLGCLWRLLSPAHGLVESGRLWQLAVEKWIFARDFVVVPGTPQVFVLRQSSTLKMLIVKVVNDILVCGQTDEIQAFYKDLSRTYKLNPLRTGSRVRFSGMNIVTDNAGLTTFNFAHYLAACSDISLSAQRVKRKDDECTPDERTAFRTLCGKLSYLGATGMQQASFLRPTAAAAFFVLRLLPSNTFASAA
jgi:Reverse transcriptase (RNA-dependent DNA polymerase)